MVVKGECPHPPLQHPGISGEGFSGPPAWRTPLVSARAKVNGVCPTRDTRTKRDCISSPPPSTSRRGILHSKRYDSPQSLERHSFTKHNYFTDFLSVLLFSTKIHPSTPPKSLPSFPAARLLTRNLLILALEII